MVLPKKKISEYQWMAERGEAAEESGKSERESECALWT